MNHKIISKFTRYLVIIIFLSWILIPVLWMVTLAFKSYPEWRVAYFFPKEPTFMNFILIFEPKQIVGMMGATALVDPVTLPFINSLLVVGASTVLSVIIGFFTAYGASRYNSPGPFSLFFTLLTRMLPPATFVTPIMVYYSNLKLLDSHLGLIMLYSAVTVTYGIWILKGFIDQVPIEWEQAALLEGASHLQVVFRVTLPIVKSGLVVSGLFIFLLNWAELLFALVLTNVQAVTLPVHISKYVGAVGQLYGPQAALGILSSLIPVIIGYIIQKHLVTAFTFGMVR
ncbi:MAG: carbohydrate ABC transporter permease [Thaumarchaeota archaeon]|jgi:multiple sugar transport system permease protein|nr:carbohydrate ABC transporter permease [Candidatus Geocrenenecus arthurdayi]MCL7403969.1 carbohydrate ABC transporter permease [Candidatus Geocrenenecus arthurdayi]